WWLRKHGDFDGPVRVTSFRCGGCGNRKMYHQGQKLDDKGQHYLTPATPIHPDYHHTWDGIVATYRDSMLQDTWHQVFHTQVTASIEAKKNYTGLVPIY